MPKLAIEASSTSKRKHPGEASTSKRKAKPMRIIKGNIKRKAASVKEEDEFPVLQTRMSPSLFFNFINSDLSDMQKSDIIEMGFGGFLCLKTDTINGHLAYWLVSNMDPYTSSLLDGELPIRDEDIHLATGLPMGEVAISQGSRFDKSEEFQEMSRVWKSQFGDVDTDRITNNDLIRKMVAQREGGELFKRNFIVYMVSAFLMGVRGNVPSLRILKCLSDVSLIPRFKWCEFTRLWLLNSVQQWEADKANEAKGKAVKIYKGPILILTFIYLDRVVFKTRKVDRVFPTLCTWSKEAISLRICQEKKEAGKFGAGFIDKRMVKEEVCFGDGFVEPGPTLQADGVVKQDTIEYDDHNPTDKRSRVSFCIDKMASTGKALAQAYENFSAALNEARILMPNSIVVSDLTKMSDSLLGGFHFTPPSRHEEGCNGGEPVANCNDGRNEATAAASSDHVTSAPAGSDHVAADIEGGEETAGGSAPTGGFHDPCWEDATFLNALFALTEAFNKDPVDKHASKKRRVAPECPTFNLFQSQDNSVSGCSPVVHTNAERDVTDTPVSPASVLGSPTTLCDTEVNDANPHGKRAITVSDVFKSPFIQRNISVLSELSQDEKDISDLVFGDSFDNSEILFRNQYFQLRRCDLQTMMVGGKINSNVINTWAHLLNKREAIKAPGSPLRLYAFVTHTGVRCDEPADFRNVKLMFFPFMTREPVLLCVNFMNSRIEVIHPMRPKSFNYADQLRAVKLYTATEMAAKSSRFQAVQFFRCEEIIPRSQAIDAVDDGIYLMHHMETYVGARKTLTTDLGHCKAAGKLLLKLKAKYCYVILSSDHNQLKDQVLSDARRLNIRSGKQVAGPSPTYTDKQLLDYVFSVSKGDEAKYDVVVQTPFGSATKEALATLKPRKWVMDMVIDMFGLYSTLLSPDLLYVPTTASNLNPSRDVKLGRNYINTSYMTTDGSSVKALFVPLIRDDHWFMCVCDLEMKKTYFLNSLHSTNLNAELEFASAVLSNVITIMVRSEGYKSFKEAPRFPVEVVEVPQQPNIFDCGLYVLKWLEAKRDISLWTDKSYYKSMPTYRKQVALCLLRWKENMRKVLSVSDSSLQQDYHCDAVTIMLDAF